MHAQDSIKNADIAAALIQLQAEIRSKPSDPKLRTFLFQLLAVTGNWERSLTQLNVVGELDALSNLMVGTYSRLLQAEVLRAEVFAGRRTPMVVGEPAPWIAMMIQALKLSADGHHREASDLRADAFEQADAVPGAVDGAAFEWISDADSRLGPCLEIMVNGGYSWVPFSRIKKLKFDAPSDLRDKIWTPVEITWANDGQAVGFIPTRYPGSESSDDDMVRLARKTDWLEVFDDVFHGLGQRVFATDASDFPLLDVRVLTFDHPVVETAAE